MGPKSNNKCPNKRQKSGRPRDSEPCEAGGGDWTDV